MSASMLFALALSVGCGSGYLTPDQVREHLDNPSGSVTGDTMPHAGDDFFKAKRADSFNGSATLIKQDSEGTSRDAQGIVDFGMERSVLVTQMASPGDVLCAAGLLTNLSKFDECEDEDNCEITLTIDSCVMRVAGDDEARGKLFFHLKNESRENYYHSQLDIEFEAFEFTTEVNDRAQFIEGILAIDVTEETTGDTDTAEVILSADVNAEIRGFERGLFNDDIYERARTTVALRFKTVESPEVDTASLEILAFVDETDDTRDESVVLSFEAESRRISADKELAGATLSVRGSNGSFDCTWSEATESHTVGTSTYTSAGECVDENGEVTTWDSTAEYTN